MEKIIVVMIIVVWSDVSFQRSYSHDLVRGRSSSSLGSCSSLTESLGEWSVGDIEEDEGDNKEFDSALFMRSRIQSVGNDRKPSPISRSPPILANSGSVSLTNYFLRITFLKLILSFVWWYIYVTKLLGKQLIYLFITMATSPRVIKMMYSLFKSNILLIC